MNIDTSKTIEIYSSKLASFLAIIFWMILAFTPLLFEPNGRNNTHTSTILGYILAICFTCMALRTIWLNFIHKASQIKINHEGIKCLNKPLITWHQITNIQTTWWPNYVTSILIQYHLNTSHQQYPVTMEFRINTGLLKVTDKELLTTLQAYWHRYKG